MHFLLDEELVTGKIVVVIILFELILAKLVVLTILA